MWLSFGLAVFNIKPSAKIVDRLTSTQNAEGLSRFIFMPSLTIPNT
jgi:hypothetical protein